MFAPFELRSTLGRSYNVDLDDTLKAKKALKKIGYFETPSYGMTKYPDEPLFRGIENFQRDNGLRRDGIMKPEGETATALGRISAESRNADKHAPKFPAHLAARRKPKGNDENCHERWNREHARCWRWHQYGTRVVRGCMERAGDRLGLCMQHGYPEPYSPEEFNEKDLDIYR